MESAEHLSMKQWVLRNLRVCLKRKQFSFCLHLTATFYFFSGLKKKKESEECDVSLKQREVKWEIYSGGDVQGGRERGVVSLILQMVPPDRGHSQNLLPV